MPRKAAYITKSFHPGRETLNAYVVYKDKESVEKALAEDGSLFMGLHIRVDKAGQSEKVCAIEGTPTVRGLFKFLYLFSSMTISGLYLWEVYHSILVKRKCELFSVNAVI